MYIIYRKDYHEVEGQSVIEQVEDSRVLSLEEVNIRLAELALAGYCGADASYVYSAE